MLYQHDISHVHLHRFLPVHLRQKFRLDNFFINVDIYRPEVLWGHFIDLSVRFSADSKKIGPTKN